MIAYGLKRELKNGAGFNSIFPSPVQARMCMGRDPERIYRLRLREATADETSPYWGWQDTGSDRFCMVQPSRKALEMCFPYGIESEIATGKGRPVNLIVEELEVYKEGT